MGKWNIGFEKGAGEYKETWRRGDKRESDLRHKGEAAAWRAINGRSVSARIGCSLSLVGGSVVLHRVSLYLLCCLEPFGPHHFFPAGVYARAVWCLSSTAFVHG